MKNKLIAIFAVLSFYGWGLTSCSHTSKNKVITEVCTRETYDVNLKDYGAEPTVLDIDAYTLTNDNFRTAIWTGKKLQVTVMSIPVGGDVGLEQHPDTDQFLRIEDGNAKVMMGDKKDSLTFIVNVAKDYAIFVPAGKWHNIINTGERTLKLYSVYSPAEHPRGTVHKTQGEANASEFHHYELLIID